MDSAAYPTKPSLSNQAQLSDENAFLSLPYEACFLIDHGYRPAPFRAVLPLILRLIPQVLDKVAVDHWLDEQRIQALLGDYRVLSCSTAIKMWGSCALYMDEIIVA